MNADTGPWAEWNHWTLDEILQGWKVEASGETTYQTAPPDLMHLAEVAREDPYYFSNIGYLETSAFLERAGTSMLIVGVAMDTLDFGSAVYADSQAAGEWTMGPTSVAAIGRIFGGTVGSLALGSVGAASCEAIYPPWRSLTCGCVGALGGGLAGGTIGMAVMETDWLKGKSNPVSPIVVTAPKRLPVPAPTPATPLTPYPR